MERIDFKVKNDQDFSIIGREVAHTHNPDDDIAYRIYETEKGNWFMTATTSEDTLIRHVTIEEKSADKLVEILGYHDYAKSLYEQLGLNTSKQLDV